jgi:hypothetical protein
VYLGTSVTNLTRIAADKSSAGPNASRVSFDTAPSTVYNIVVDGGYPFTEGHISLQLSFDYAPRVSIASPASGASFASLAQIPVIVLGSDRDGSIKSVELYADSFFGVVTNYGSPSNTFFFSNVAGGSFVLTARVVDDSGQERISNPITVNVSLTNNFFRNRVRLSGYQFVAFGTTVGATSEPGEPGDDFPLDGERKSVWWEWIAPVTGVATVRAESNEYSSGVEVYTGNTVATLTRIAAHINDFGRNEVSFNVSAGTPYQISVDGFHFAVGTASGKYRLSGGMQGLDSFRIDFGGQPTGSSVPLRVQGIPGMEFLLQVSTNLANWSDVTTQTLSGSTLNLIDTNVANSPKRFYRLRTTH